MLRPEVALYTYVMLLLVALGLGYGYYTKKIKWYSGR